MLNLNLPAPPPKPKNWEFPWDWWAGSTTAVFCLVTIGLLYYVPASRTLSSWFYVPIVVGSAGLVGVIALLVLNFGPNGWHVQREVYSHMQGTWDRRWREEVEELSSQIFALEHLELVESTEYTAYAPVPCIRNPKVVWRFSTIDRNLLTMEVRVGDEVVKISLPEKDVAYDENALRDPQEYFVVFPGMSITPCCTRTGEPDHMGRLTLGPTARIFPATPS